MSLSASRTAFSCLVATIGFVLIVSTAIHRPSSIVHASARVDRAAAQALFHEKGCEHCHGVDGVGGEKGPSLSGVGRKLKPPAIRSQILNGGEAMPAFADALTPDEVNALVGYLSTKRKASHGKASPTTVQPSPKADSGGSDDQ